MNPSIRDLMLTVAAAVAVLWFVWSFAQQSLLANLRLENRALVAEQALTRCQGEKK